MKTRDQQLLQMVHLLSEENGRSPRDIFLRLGMTQGLVNRDLEPLTSKSWFKLFTAPAKRMYSWMMPKATREKSLPVYDFLTCTYRFFRKAHRKASRALHETEGHWARKVDVHSGDRIADVADTSLRENGPMLAAMVEADIAASNSFDAPLVTRRELRQLASDGVPLMNSCEIRAHASLSRNQAVALVEHEPRVTP